MIDSVKKVQTHLNKTSCTSNIMHAEATIFTVTDASRAIGTEEKNILKSIILRVNHGEKHALALMSGVNRVDTKKIRRILDAKHVSFESGEVCETLFGFKPGGVPPIGYDEPITALLDTDLWKCDTVWAAAGTDHDFFPISPDELLRITNGQKADIAKQ